MRRRLVVCLTVALLVAPRSAGAWGFEAHRFITARAILRLPRELRPFFERHRTQLVEHSIDPDLWRTAGWVDEPPRHFLDLDAYGPYPFPDLARDYDQAVARYGREFVVRNGLVPWRASEIYGRLVEAFTQKSPYSRENIKFFSSVLSHYVSDAHVPLHAVVNYDGQQTGQAGIHARFEAELFERYRSQLTVTPRSNAPVGPVRDFVFDTLLASFPLAEQVLEADRAAVAGRDVYDDRYFAMFFSRVRPVLERRLADSITASASVITAAWIEAGRPSVAVEPGRVPRPVRR